MLEAKKRNQTNLSLPKSKLNKTELDQGIHQKRRNIVTKLKIKMNGFGSIRKSVG